ncbi:MAG: LCP family protein [Sporichthyaceae bacterium]|nr:LCP family protein [Sporichthyaceae bacterium]
MLLLGGDGGDGRQGIRADTLILASIDTKTGETLMISLPRNLYRAPFRPGSAADLAFPDGFLAPPGAPQDDYLLNAMYRYGQDNPAIAGSAEYPGSALVSESVSTILGLPIDYFVLVNLEGFADIVDALGGIQIRVTERIPIGGKRDPDGSVEVQPHGWIEPRLYRNMDGYHALWYARSRFLSEDYDRMIRQRCVMGAIARQADPARVLVRFQSLARASQGLIVTDIPPNMLSPLATLALKGKDAKITGASVDKSVFGPSSLTPDYDAIRAKAQQWLRSAERSAQQTLARQQSPSAAPTGSPTGSPVGSPSAPPGSGQPTGSDSPGASGSVDPIEGSCQYD